ncbi:hypothetical protein CHARACLAT_002466 [Characodon lateralis]|uniref:Prolactin receptor n=1 Tax=Characodon lateralis TaxID=208331 RepID=A0ABU7EZL1_9TELE|nr:hypothetical protein [Characodon lateralis]
MSDMMKVEAEDHRRLSLTVASTSVLKQTKDSKDPLFPVHQMFVIKEEAPHDWGPSLNQQDQNSPFIKGEEEDLWISQEEEELAVKVKYAEKPQLSEIHQIKTEDNRETEAPTRNSAEQMVREPDDEDCGGPTHCSQQNQLVVYEMSSSYYICQFSMTHLETPGMQGLPLI